VSGMRAFVLGVVVGQALALGVAASPGGHHARAQRALLDSGPTLASRGAADAAGPVPGRGARETTVPLEQGLGVWTAPVVLNHRHQARFLVDTGSSVTVLSPRLAARAGIAERPGGVPVELHTLGGLTAGPTAVVASLRVGHLELRDLTVVLHDPGPAFDGILGNTVLGRYRVTLDTGGRRLHLGPARD
jgi:predicted aspartyl protease